jgi:hypothetical protein
MTRASPLDSSGKVVLRLGHSPRIFPATYVKPFAKGQKNCEDLEYGLAELCKRQPRDWPLERAIGAALEKSGQS